jgi:hypothetical protein
VLVVFGCLICGHLDTHLRFQALSQLAVTAGDGDQPARWRSVWRSSMQPVATTTVTLVSRRPYSSRRVMEFLVGLDGQPRGWPEGYQPLGMHGDGCRGVKAT